MQNNPVCWFEIYVQDMPRAKAFYESVFGVSLARLDGPGIEMWTFAGDPERGGAAGALVHAPGVPSGGCGTIVYFRCADCGVEEARAERSGGRIHRPKMSIGQYGFISLVFDTEGNMIGLYSQA